MNVELAQDARATIGEGPVWDDRSQRLVWVDIPDGLVHRFSPGDGSDAPLEAGQAVGSVGLGREGGLVLAVPLGFALVAAGSERPTEVIDVGEQLANNRMNDGACDPAGRFLAGTMDRDHAPGMGSLYRLEQEGGKLGTTRLLDGLTISNGIDWSPDGSSMYFIDSATQRIDRFSYRPDDGLMRDRTVFATIAPRDGLPDGLTVDAEGHVWVALFGAGRVRRYSPAGEIAAEIGLPVSLVTSLAFGGVDLADLYVTSARHRLEPAESARQVHAGSLFVCRPGPAGRQPNRFAWI
jgi:sugar lactone lactonase YvrE